MSENEYRPKSIMCVVAHPDDIEYCIGATLAKWVEQGTEVSYLICTDGSGGTDDIEQIGRNISSIRSREQQEAARRMGAKCTHQLDFIDGKIEYDERLSEAIVRQIRIHKPEAVFTFDPTFVYSTDWNYPNHRDHRVVGQAAFDAVYPFARDIGTFPNHREDSIEPHSVSTLLMFNYDKQNFYVDVSDSFDKSIDSLKAHVSQFGNGEKVIKSLREKCERMGNENDMGLAQGMVKLDIN